MQPYSVRAAEVACASTVVVQVLLSRDNDDLELIRLGVGNDYISSEDFTRRQLRSVGIVGISGTKTSVAFKEPLDEHTVSCVADAFAEYIRVLIGEDFAERVAQAEIAELERLYRLPDPRPYPHVN